MHGVLWADSRDFAILWTPLLFADGQVVWQDLSVSPKTHVAEVNKALDGLL